MKMTLGTFSIDFNEDVIGSCGKSSYVACVVKSLEWTKLSVDLLTEKVGEVYDVVRGNDE